MVESSEITQIPIPDEPAHTSLESNRRFPRKRTIAAGLGFAGVSLAAGFGQIYADDPLLVPAFIVEGIGDNDCATIERDVFQQVDNILSSGDDPKLSRLYNRLKRADERGNFERASVLTGRINEYFGEIAERNGITILNPKETVDLIQSSQTVEEINEHLRNFTSQYGINLTFPTTREISDVVTSFDPVPLEGQDAHTHGLYAGMFAEYLSLLPVEVVKLSGIENIKVVSNLTTFGGQKYDPEDRSAGQANAFNDTVYIDYDLGFMTTTSGIVLNHELAHGIDATICGNIGAYRDSEFDDLNPEGFNYVGDGISLNSSGVTANEYGAVHPTEDKAVIYEKFLSGFTLNYRDQSPVIQEKIELLLTRLEANIPGISNYYREMILIDQTS